MNFFSFPVREKLQIPTAKTLLSMKPILHKCYIYTYTHTHTCQQRVRSLLTFDKDNHNHYQ